MSSREPLWFCHQCQAEMRPLMMPDPVCASCRGSFVEKMEDPADDPRDFAHSGNVDFGEDGLPPGIDAFLLTLQSLMDRGIADRTPQTVRFNPDNPIPANRFTFQMRTGSGQRPSRMYDSDLGSLGRPPTMSEFIRRGAGPEDGPTITGPVMAQYLMALLGQRDPSNDIFGRGIGDLSDGRMGDYVFNQEALDHIITQLMENSNAHRPVPATEEVITQLPREVLEMGSPTLDKDCAVCKDQFKLETDDPDEQVVVTLPCKHPFHEPCILPWLKSSGTCPVCRYALVPQPDHHPPPASPGPDTTGSRGHPTRPSRSQRPSSQDGPRQDGIFHSLFAGWGARNGTSSTGAPGSSSGHHRSNSDPSASGRVSDPRNNLPGSWNDDLD
ncbi:hypothetical protein L208DRAFT_1450868 [Tricholoma matsutake]|nr:hypothetical protein L208DRAFT_1450868 [Tricholoma matsutake 945]